MRACWSMLKRVQQFQSWTTASKSLPVHLRLLLLPISPYWGSSLPWKDIFFSLPLLERTKPHPEVQYLTFSSDEERVCRRWSASASAVTGLYCASKINSPRCSKIVITARSRSVWLAASRVILARSRTCTCHSSTAARLIKPNLLADILAIRICNVSLH